MNKHGSVVIISLWILIILALSAVTLGHRAAVSVRLAHYQKERLTADCLARSGVSHGIAELIRDRDGNTYDDLHETWSTGIDSETGKPLFENRSLAEGSLGTFTIRYLFNPHQRQYLCMADEERKINVTQCDTIRQREVIELLQFLGWDEIRAQEFARLIADWIDADAKTVEGIDEENFFKNAPFQATEELLAVLEHFYGRHNEVAPRQKALQEYARLAPYITVYTQGKININTALIDVLKLVMRAMLTVESVPSVIETDVDGLCSYVLAFRASGGSFPRVDAAVVEQDLASFGTVLTSGQKNILNQLVTNNLVTVKSDTFYIESTGMTAKKITKKIVTVITRSGNAQILRWHES